jgi:hypothetical protein
MVTVTAEGVLFVYSRLGYWTGEDFAEDFTQALHYPDGAASLKAAAALSSRLSVACSSGYFLPAQVRRSVPSGRGSTPTVGAR